jgi:phage tail tape-measure protein
MSDFTVKLVLKAFDQASAPLKNVSGALAGVSKNNRGLVGGLAVAGPRLGGIAASIVTAGAALSGAAAGIAGVFGRKVLDTAATFERFRTVLETTEGSAEKARSAFAWINDFEGKTPYALEEVTAAFVKMRAYGLDPTRGLLQALGDTAAAMDKPLIQAVEAVADAVTGENERLKQFGITASKTGNQIVYEYTHNGQQLRKVARANSRTMIEETLKGIFNQKYAGAMDKLSRTWAGLTSTLGSHWSRFLGRVAEGGGAGGPFGTAKDQLSGLVGTLDEMDKSGQLQRLADIIGGEMAKGLNEAAAAFKRLVDDTGGIEAWAQGIGDAFKGASALIAGVADGLRSVSKGLEWVNKNVAALPGLGGEAPRGPTVAGIGLGERGLIPWLVNQFRGGPPDGGAVTGGAGDSFLGGGAGGDTLGSSPVLPPPSALAPIASARGAAPSFTGEIAIKLAGAPKGTRLEGMSTHSDRGLSVDLGLSLVP